MYETYQIEQKLASQSGGEASVEKDLVNIYVPSGEAFERCSRAVLSMGGRIYTLDTSLGLARLEE